MAFDVLIKGARVFPVMVPRYTPTSASPAIVSRRSSTRYPRRTQQR